MLIAMHTKLRHGPSSTHRVIHCSILLHAKNIIVYLNKPLWVVCFWPNMVVDQIMIWLVDTNHSADSSNHACQNTTSTWQDFTTNYRHAMLGHFLNYKYLPVNIVHLQILNKIESTCKLYCNISFFWNMIMIQFNVFLYILGVHVVIFFSFFKFIFWFLFIWMCWNFFCFSYCCLFLFLYLCSF